MAKGYFGRPSQETFLKIVERDEHTGDERVLKNKYLQRRPVTSGPDRISCPPQMATLRGETTGSKN